MSDWISYAEFGDRFIRRAVVERRVREAIAGATSGSFQVGPINALLLEATVYGSFGQPRVVDRSAEHVEFGVAVPVSLDVVIKSIGGEYKFGGDLIVNLVLTARAAAPLQLYIDVAPLTGENLTVQLRAEGPGASVLRSMSVLDREIRRQVATLINARLASPESVASRTIDVAAKIDGTQPTASATGAPPKIISYGEFGVRFFRHAVTAPKIAAAMASIGGQQVVIGPIKAGPREMAEVNANGLVGAPQVAPRSDGDYVVFDAVVPVQLDLSVVLGHGKDNRYHAQIDIPIVMAARGADPLRVLMDVNAVTPEQVRVEVQAEGLRAGVLKKAGGIENQIRQQVAKKVNEQILDPVAAQTRGVDVGERIDSA